MANVSDRGGAFPTPEVMRQVLLDERERRERGEVPDHPLLANVRALSREDIEVLAEHYGSREAAAGKIAAAATVQLASVKIVTGVDDSPPQRARRPSMYERLAEIDASTELNAEDKQWLKSEALRRYGRPTHAHQEIRYEMSLRDPERVTRDQYGNHDFSRVRDKHELKRARLAEARRAQKRIRPI